SSSETSASRIKDEGRLAASRLLNLHDDRHDDGARAGLFLDEAFELDADALFEERRVAALLARGDVDGVRDDALHLAEQPGGAAVAVQAEDAAGDDFGRGFQLARLVDGDDGRDHAVVGELAALAHDLAVNLLEAGVVYEGAAHVALVNDGGALAVEFQNVPVLDEDDVLFGEVAVVLQEFLVAVEHPVLAVDGDDEAGPDGLGHDPDVLLRGVAADVDQTPLLVNDRGAAPVNQADGAGDGATEHADLAVELLRHVNDDLQAVNRRGEGGDEDAPLGLGENLLEVGDDGALRGRSARHGRVRRVGREREHALLPVAPQGSQIY